MSACFRLGRALALLAAIVCALVMRPEHSPTTDVQLAIAEQLASPPIPDDGERHACIAFEIDVELDEVGLVHDDAAPCTLAPSFALEVLRSSELQCASSRKLPVAKAWLALGAHLARGPPAALTSITL